jgi:hypothetical protein
LQQREQPQATHRLAASLAFRQLFRTEIKDLQVLVFSGM